jgi:large repetitive protein
VRLVSSDEVSVKDGMLILQLANDEFTRGVTGEVWFRLENSGQEEIEIITATAAGRRPSSTVRFQLVDEDDNVLVTAPFTQATGENLVSLANNNVVARIPAGRAFTSEPTSITIPSGVPDQVRVRLIIDSISYHQTRDDQVIMQGLTGEHRVRLMDTSYYGELLSITPKASFGEEDIFISGMAVDRDSKQPLAEAILKLVITVAGYDRIAEVETDINGEFTYTFTPLEGESGRYAVSLVHPDLLDKPVHDRFTIGRVLASPQNIKLTAPRNYEESFFIEVAAGAGSNLTNLRLEYNEEDQPESVYPEGVTVTLVEPVTAMEEQSKIKIPVKLWANNIADDRSRLILRLISDEAPPEGWATIRIDTLFTTAEPTLFFEPNRIEAGVVQGDVVTEHVKLENRGLAAMEEVRLTLVDLDENPAPSWVNLSIPEELGDIEVGEERDVPITFTPGNNVEEGAYSFILQVEAFNNPTTNIYLFVIVNLDGEGGALFKVSNIYTGTIGQDGNLIQGLENATITLQNENTLITEPEQKTDHLGEAMFSDLPAGNYKCRITAPNHQEQISRVTIKPGLTATRDVFLDYTLVTVTWEVKEITIEDRYEIILKATFESDVPAPVVVTEPTSLSMPKLKKGMVYNGEFTLTNHGFIRADDLRFEIPPSDENFRFELLKGVPDSLAAKEKVVIPYRITCLKDLEQDDGSGGGKCFTYRKCLRIPYKYKCANDHNSSGSTLFCWTYAYGSCGGGGGGGSWRPVGGGGGGGWYGVGGSGGGGGSVSYPAPPSEPIKGVKCLPKPAKPCPPCQDNKPGEDDDNNVPVGSVVNTILRQYNRSNEDISVKIPGGAISEHRYYENDRWNWSFDRHNLEFKYDGSGTVVEVLMGGISYTADSFNGDSYRNRSFRILRTDSGYIWKESRGDWKTFDDQGKLLAYGTHNRTIAMALYEDGRFTGWLDGDGNQLLWYSYQGDKISMIEDIEGRSVSYTYSGDNIHTFTNLRGYATTYGYSGGKLSRIEEPGGKVRNIHLRPLWRRRQSHRRQWSQVPLRVRL